MGYADMFNGMIISIDRGVILETNEANNLKQLLILKDILIYQYLEFY